MDRTKTCGDCIHAVICKQVNGGWFSPKNIAYCTAFKDRAEYVPVVRCKDCKWYKEGKYLAPNKFCYRLKDRSGEHIGYNFSDDDFCSYGERRGNE